MRWIKNKYVLTFYMLLLFSSNSAGAFDGYLPKQSLVPGGVGVFSIETTEKPTAYFYQNRVLVAGDAENWHAVVGLPLGIKPGKHQLNLHFKTHSETLNFTVHAKEYPAQYLEIKNKRHVNPNADDLARINKEKRIIQQVKKNWSDVIEVPLRFMQPSQGRYSSQFGLRRFLNNQPRSPHRGLDIAATEGTPVYAPADGVVINTGDYFFNGNSVFLDHGQGLITFYCHLAEISVQEGMQLKTGDMLGRVGNTGRSTAPHLHWSVILNNTMVDPLLFLSAQ